MRRLAEAGIDVGVGLAPILPGLSDRPGQIEAVVRAAKAAGARGVWAAPVHLRPGVREHFLEALARDWPELVGRYEELFAERSYLPSAIATPSASACGRPRGQRRSPSSTGERSGSGARNRRS